MKADFTYKGYQIFEEERLGKTIYSLETLSGMFTVESSSFTAMANAINSLPEAELFDEYLLRRTTNGGGHGANN